jgi:hypothetical protein
MITIGSLFVASGAALAVDRDFATVTGYAEGSAENNHAETWGSNCTKPYDPEGEGDLTYLLPMLDGGYVYDQVIVKAGSDVSTDSHANTVFDDPAAGETVWADTNGNGTFDPEKVGDVPADKHISHVIVCTRLPELGSITVDKVVAGTGASTTEAFSFTMTDEEAFTLTGPAAPKVIDDLEAGVYVVAETALTAGQTTAGWAFTSVACTGGGTVIAGQQATVTLAEGQDVTCTFTNTFTAPTPLTPTLTLDKVVSAGASTTTKFGFTLGGQAVSTTLSAADSPLLLASSAGAYVLAENAMTGWGVSAIDCTGNAAAESVNLTTRTVTVTVGANEDVVCTFTNTPQGGQVLPGNPTPAPTATPKPTPRGAVLPSTSMPVPGLDLSLIGTLFLLAGSGFGAAGLIERRRR